MVTDRTENKELFEIWYGEHKFRTKNLKEYLLFMNFLFDEILLRLAHLCKGFRQLEGRE